MGIKKCVLKIITFATLIVASGMAYSGDIGYAANNRPVTIWLVVINNPEACASMPCTEDDIFGVLPANPTKATVCYLTGQVVRASGKAVFGGRLGVGTGHGCFFPDDPNPYVLMDPARAEVHIVVQEHGAPLPGGRGLEEQVSQFEGGCNPECTDSQFATHVATDAVDGVSVSSLQRFADGSEIANSASTLVRDKFGITVVNNTHLDDLAP